MIGKVDGLGRAPSDLAGVFAPSVRIFIDGLRRQGLELHSFMLYRRGFVVAEGWWAPYRADRVHLVHSAAKSFTATGVGLAIDDGLLRLDDKVAHFFPEHLPARPSSHLEAMTVRHLLTMTTGHASGISGGEWRGIRTSWLAEFFKEPVPDPPGHKFIYSSASSYVLSAIIQKVTGKSLSSYMQSRLFEPMGIEPPRWDVSPEGINTGGNGLSCTTADLLKLGILHLNGGTWQGRRLLSEKWIKDATRPQTRQTGFGAFTGKRYLPSEEDALPSHTFGRMGYGYQWWMGPYETYAAHGFYGQYCIVFPREQAVFACTGGLAIGETRVESLIWTHLLPPLRDGGTPTSAATGTTRDGTRNLRLDLPSSSAVRPTTAPSGDFIAEPNDTGVIRITFSFEDDRCVFTLSDRRGIHRIDAGIGRWIESETTMSGGSLHHGYEPERVRVSAAGHWENARTFSMTWIFIETAFRDTLTCAFDGDSVRIVRRVNVSAEGPGYLSFTARRA